ncbi:MAG TPA: SET domain-containing protein-lysine N-methyltransferase [Edaphocola sp.]|nr:SET domain-containing protein-lysine N-methyltransferase [Edaphocola sp.]
MECFIADCLYVKTTKEMGRGVFTKEAIPQNVIIEISPVLKMSSAERKLLDQTELYNYIFEWGENHDQCCVAWGYTSLYNHQFGSNCEYMMSFEEGIIKIRTMRSILANEELFINYNGDWDNETSLWFDTK